LARAKLLAVTVTRLDGVQFKNYSRNFIRMLVVRQTEQFYLKPSDIVKVPERLWY